MTGGPPPLPLISIPSWLAGADITARKVPDPGGTGGPAAPTTAATAGLGATVTVPPLLKAGLDTAWTDSFPGGKSQEQAGVLVQKADGTQEWRRVVDGTSGTLSGGAASFDYPKLVGAGETLLAAAHTHPYDASEGGHKDVSFSGADLARMTSVPDPQHYVRAGDSVFMIAKTPDFEKLVTISGAGTLNAEMNKRWSDTFSAATGTIQSRADAATKAVCHEYHLDYYSGKGDTLTKVNTAK